MAWLAGCDNCPPATNTLPFNGTLPSATAVSVLAAGVNWVVTTPKRPPPDHCTSRSLQLTSTGMPLSTTFTTRPDETHADASRWRWSSMARRTAPLAASMRDRRASTTVEDLMTVAAIDARAAGITPHTVTSTRARRIAEPRSSRSPRSARSGGALGGGTRHRIVHPQCELDAVRQQRRRERLALPGAGDALEGVTRLGRDPELHRAVAARERVVEGGGPGTADGIGGAGAGVGRERPRHGAHHVGAVRGLGLRDGSDGPAALRRGDRAEDRADVAEALRLAGVAGEVVGGPGVAWALAVPRHAADHRGELAEVLGDVADPDADDAHTRAAGRI